MAKQNQPQPLSEGNIVEITESTDESLKKCKGEVISTDPLRIAVVHVLTFAENQVKVRKVFDEADWDAVRKEAKKHNIKIKGTKEELADRVKAQMKDKGRVEIKGQSEEVAAKAAAEAAQVAAEKALAAQKAAEEAAEAQEAALKAAAAQQAAADQAARAAAEDTFKPTQRVEVKPGHPKAGIRGSVIEGHPPIQVELEGRHGIEQFTARQLKKLKPILS